MGRLEEIKIKMDTLVGVTVGLYGDEIVVEQEYTEDDPENPCKNDDDCVDEANDLGREMVEKFPELEVTDTCCHRHKYSIVSLGLKNRNNDLP
jgi:hypothetical protein